RVGRSARDSRATDQTRRAWSRAWHPPRSRASRRRGGAVPRPAGPWRRTPSRHRTAWRRPHPAPGGGRIPAAGCHRTRPRRPRGMPSPPLVSLAQPQIRALVSRVPMPNENLAGRTIAGYRLLERVGEGGTAEVYRAQHPGRGPCAFKVLRSRLASDPTAVKRFLREAGHGPQLGAPGAARTLHHGDEGQLIELAPVWAEGDVLAEN